MNQCYKCPPSLDFPSILCHTISMNKQTKLTNYSNGVFASNEYLASIARECIEHELMQRQCRRAARDAGVNEGTWNVNW